VSPYFGIFVVISIFVSTIGCLSEEPISPIPSDIQYDTDKARLGKRLFFDTKLSSDGSVSCANCHRINNGADVGKFSYGVGGREGNRNSPTVFNSVFNFRQMYNGSAADLARQAAAPIENPVEMHNDSQGVLRYLRNDSSYIKEFEKVYGKKEIEYRDVLDAIAEFEKTLITPNSRFDRYLRGEIDLSEEEKEGYRLFKTLGCITCHNGTNVGGNSYQKMGLINPYPWSEDSPDRFSISKREDDKNVYKVPSLRNIAVTAPYFHDGSAATLEEALAKMGYYNLGFKLSKREIALLKAFLQTLTGEIPKSLRKGGL
jgi:cytochrome c peroxidase